MADVNFTFTIYHSGFCYASFYSIIRIVLLFFAHKIIILRLFGLCILSNNSHLHNICHQTSNQTQQTELASPYDQNYLYSPFCVEFYLYCSNNSELLFVQKNCGNFWCGYLLVKNVKSNIYFRICSYFYSSDCSHFNAIPMDENFDLILFDKIK